MKTIEMQINNVVVVVHYNDIPEQKDIEAACIQFIRTVEKNINH